MAGKYHCGTGWYAYLHSEYESQYSRISVQERNQPLADYVIERYQAGESLNRSTLPGDDGRPSPIQIMDTQTAEIIFGDADRFFRRGQVDWTFSTEDGRQYTAVVSIPPRRVSRLDLLSPQVVAVAVIASILASWGLTALVALPIRRLQTHVQTLGNGTMDAQLEASLLSRRDEIGDLARDVDQMSQRIMTLIENQQRLLADVSHELRAPMARIQVAAEIVRSQFEDDSKDAEVLNHLDKDVQSLNQLVEELLQLVRSDTQKDPQQTIELNELLEPIVQDLRFGWPERIINTHFGEGALVENTRPISISRAFGNILENALKYSDATQPIDVSTEYSSEQWVVRIADRGKGIPEDQLNAIFQPFTRLEPESVGGFGLGLSIAQRGVELVGGSIHMRNRSGGGLEVDIRIPRVH